MAQPPTSYSKLYAQICVAIKPLSVTELTKYCLLIKWWELLTSHQREKLDTDLCNVYAWNGERDSHNAVLDLTSIIRTPNMSKPHQSTLLVITEPMKTNISICSAFLSCFSVLTNLFTGNIQDVVNSHKFIEFT